MQIIALTARCVLVVLCILFKFLINFYANTVLLYNYQKFYKKMKSYDLICHNS
jgi:hypothetical protein